MWFLSGLCTLCICLYLCLQCEREKELVPSHMRCCKIDREKDPMCSFAPFSTCKAKNFIAKPNHSFASHVLECFMNNGVHRFLMLSEADLI